MHDAKTLAAEMMDSERVTLLDRLSSGPDSCPFCRRDPFHYVDNGVGMERVAVVCCEAGITLYDNSDSDFRRVASDMAEAATAIRTLCEGLAEAERERDALKRDLAMRPSSLTTLYEVRKAMGLNEYFPLSHLETHCQSARRVLYGEPIPPANESLLDLAERMRRSLHDYQARVIPAESKIVELEGRVADLEAELASARRGILPEYPPDYPGGFDGPTGAE